MNKDVNKDLELVYKLIEDNKISTQNYIRNLWIAVYTLLGIVAIIITIPYMTDSYSFHQEITQSNINDTIVSNGNNK